MKVLIVGGVAGGASAATRLRRLDEKAEIIIFERGEHISFANCGLPYYIGNVIKRKDNLLLQTPEAMKIRFNIDVRVRTEVIEIDRNNKKVRVKNLETGQTYSETYDKLILSPGAEPINPPIEGTDLPNVFTLRNIPDTYRIKEYAEIKRPRSAIVVGGGFIGIEMAENLLELGIEVTLVEFANQVITPMDYEMASVLHNHIRRKGVNLILNNALAKISKKDNGTSEMLICELNSGEKLEAGMVLLCIGVRPESKLAKEAGLALGIRDSIKVDEHLRTSDPDIYAVGDVIEVKNFVTGDPALIPLAGPANKQGRIAADNIAGRDVIYKGTQGSSVIKVFDMTAAFVGINEKTAKSQGIPYEKTYIHPLNRAGYYPGGKTITMKLLFSPDGGKILGAQAVGHEGVEKRIDVIATAQRLGATVFDLEELELCYAPPYSSAKDPVNMLGFTASNIIRGEMKIFHWDQIDYLVESGSMLIDVRTPEEFMYGSINGAINIPLDEMRNRISELPKDRALYLFCQVGLRGYIAQRILFAKGYSEVYNLSGGYRLYYAVKENERHM